eukprot:5641492-Amphidinium_carterae.1
MACSVTDGSPESNRNGCLFLAAVMTNWHGSKKMPNLSNSLDPCALIVSLVLVAELGLTRTHNLHKGGEGSQELTICTRAANSPTSGGTLRRLGWIAV